MHMEAPFQELLPQISSQLNTRAARYDFDDLTNGIEKKMREESAVSSPMRPSVQNR
jgi:hypothetical protein